MAMTLRDYLAFRCDQMLRAERGILMMNNKIAEEVQTPSLKQQFQQHSSTTEQQIRNLEQIVDRLGGQREEGGILSQVGETLGIGAGDQGTPTTDAMMEEHRTFMGMNPPQNLIDINDAVEGNKVEHFEIASYTALIGLANQLGEAEVAMLLQQNLEGEQGMRSSIESSLPSLLSDLGGGRMAA